MYGQNAHPLTRCNVCAISYLTDTERAYKPLNIGIDKNIVAHTPRYLAYRKGRLCAYGVPQPPKPIYAHIR